ncbi:hypothetical protein IU479_07185 [Nocardia abscessus]|uniref:hypothetical protein n=1 Tax=Nocardia TaxID=1817 RepID=UPI00189408AC|nr:MULTISPECIES: hypothetical protein [Nocardia]MBF6217891.1 hypothetical protein [Nocardia abscessus]MDE1668300.1 hypothetical protein [Nocardia gipuzkoensis]
MAGDVNVRTLLAASALAMLLSGCGLLPRTHPETYEIPTSNHTIQELCGATKQFFALQAGTDNLRISPGAGGKALTDKIGGGNGCFYEKADGSTWRHLGLVSPFRIIVSGNTLSRPPSTTGNYPAKLLTVDGVTVKVVTEPLPKKADPATTPLEIDLAASIDGWEGELHFYGTGDRTTRDDQLIREGAVGGHRGTHHITTRTELKISYAHGSQNGRNRSQGSLPQ